MKAKVLQIHWHGASPVYSVSLGIPSERLATGGGDGAVRMWNVQVRHGVLAVEFLSTLTRHSRAVNAVAFGSRNSVLASGGDDGIVVLWRQVDAPPDHEEKEKWQPISIYRTPSNEDVYDLNWSVDGTYLMAGLTNRTTMIWNGHQNTCVKMFKDHNHFVQGVAWDPLGELAVTQSNDKTVRVYRYKTRRGKLVSKCQQTLAKVPDLGKLFHDETLPSFFRRLSFAPDGSLLFVPAGICVENDTYCVYFYTRASLVSSGNAAPIASLGPFDSPALIVKSNPRLFKAREQGGLFALAHRIVIAVATLTEIWFYSTDKQFPFAFVKDIHCAPITDLEWSSDGSFLVVSSSDGYCSTVCFDSEELGQCID